MNPQQVVDTFREIEKLKSVLRHSFVSSGRTESVAEHSWSICFLALSLFDQLKVSVDQLKVLKMLIIHDLPEIITQDIPAHIKKDLDRTQVFQQEIKALTLLTNNLEPKLQQEILELFKEFEARETPESLLANALDKLEAVLQHNASDISTWDEGDFMVHPYYRNEFFEYDPYLRELKDFVDIQSMVKIEQAQMLDRIDPRHVSRYKKGVK